ncbi:MAG: hypothetical protein HC899_36850 [Leptolyngbyaceae cyanobacterium SM1_4_3]|nr:hypothetical protein [Leptolyngbyaceae cyanobacterium SM1_4_3]
MDSNRSYYWDTSKSRQTAAFYKNSVWHPEAGWGAAATVGGMGLAAGGTAVAITAAPVIAAGAVVGLAAYGLRKVFFG